MPTIGDSYRKQIDMDGNVYSLDIMDTSGHEENAALRDQYMKIGEVMIVVFSICSRICFDEAHNMFSIIAYAHNNSVKHFKEGKPRVILVGNKIDLEGERVVSKDEAQALADKYGIPYIETSAKTGINVNELFELIVRMPRYFIVSSVSIGKIIEQLMEPSRIGSFFSYRRKKAVEEAEQPEHHLEQTESRALSKSSSE